MNANKLLSLIFQLVLGTFILIALFHVADSGSVLAVLLSIDLRWIGAAFGPFIVGSIMVGLALWIALRSMKNDPSMFNVVMSSYSGQLLSDISPARSGYFLTPLILNMIDGTPVNSGIVGVTATGAINFFVKAVLAVISLAYFTERLFCNSTIIYPLVVGIAVFCLGGVGLTALLWIRGAISVSRKVTKYPLIGKAVNRITILVEALQKEAFHTRKAIMPMALLITISAIAASEGAYFVSLSCRIHQLSMLDIIFIYFLVNAFMYVPFTVAGLGAQESGYVILLVTLGVPINQALSFALIVRVLFTGTDIIGLPYLLRAGTKAIFKKISLKPLE